MALKLLHRPLIVSGPSGVGKTSLIKDLLKDYGNKFELMISHTTRGPRKNEQHGVHYYFTAIEDFKKMALEQKFLESNQVHENFYGSSIDELVRIDKMKKIALFDIDIKGAMDINKYKDVFVCNYMFVLPPSQEELRQRLIGRKSEADEVIQLRLKNAQEEIDQARKSGLYTEKDYIIKYDWHSYKDFLQRVKELYDLS